MHFSLEETEDFCDKWLASWTGGSGSVEKLLSFYTTNAFYLDPVYPNGLNGHQELRPYFLKLLARNPTWIWNRDEIFLTANGFTLKWSAKIFLQEVELDIRGLDIVEIKNDKIIRNEVYFDRSKLISRN